MLDEIAKLALEADETRDDTALNEALCAAIRHADADAIWAMLSVPGGGDIHGDGQLPTPVVAAIVERGLTLRDAQVLGTAVRMSQFHCAGLVTGDVRKPLGVRALSDAQGQMRALWPRADARLRVTILHALAVAEGIDSEDVARLHEALHSEDVEVRALALMVHAAVGGPGRDDLLVQHLDHASALIRLVAAISLARAGGTRPPTEATIAVLRAAHTTPIELPRWWVFQWLDGPETASDLAQHMLEAAGEIVASEAKPAAPMAPEAALPPGADAWRAHVWEQMSLDDALAAVLALPASERLAVTWSDRRSTWYGLETPACREAHRTRDYQLLIAAVRSIAASDLDLAAAVQAAFPDPQGVDLLSLAVAAFVVLADRELGLTDDDWERLADGFDMASGHPLIEGVFQQTSEAARKRIEDILF